MLVRRFACRPLGLALIGLVTCVASESPAQNVTPQNRQVLEFYGGRSAARTLSQMPHRSTIQLATSGPVQHNGKPFQSTTASPTVSPYLNLFREEQGATDPVPSYYTFVRPQLEQQASYQQQQREIEQIRRQMQGGTSTAQRPTYGVGTQARYFDTAQFYGGWQR